MPGQFPRCRLVPLPDHQVSFEIDGAERLRWHFGRQYPRPFFYPLRGPGGTPLTRMGHPGAPNHDHHRSIWFAHQQVLGIDFWSDQTEARIEQRHWLAYHDSDEEAVMASRLDWFDGHDPRPLLEQELVASVRPSADGETLLELQATFVPDADALEFGKTNFGFLAVRVAKHISAHFGGGNLHDSEGRLGEPAIFGNRARWMDYSGPVPGGGAEGITYFDHPSNPGHPAAWHVREDGWMGAAVCLNGPQLTRRERPLVLRYLLHAHAGGGNRQRADALAEEFAATARFAVSPSQAPHRQFEVRRLPAGTSR